MSRTVATEVDRGCAPSCWSRRLHRIQQQDGSIGASTCARDPLRTPRIHPELRTALQARLARSEVDAATVPTPSPATFDLSVGDEQDDEE